MSPVGHGAKPIPGVPASYATELAHLAREVFAYGYVTAMHLTMIMPIIVIAVAGLSCIWVKKDTAGTSPVPADVAPLPEASQAPA